MLAAYVVLAAWVAITPPQPFPHPPTPNGGNAQTQQQSAPAQERHDSNTNQRGTESAPLVVQIAQPEGHEAITTKSESEPQGYANPDWWVAGFTGLLFLATTGLWVVTWFLWSSTRVLVGEERTHAQRELRAYVGVENLALECPSELNMEGYAPLDITVQPLIYKDYTAVTVRNFGQTPAREVCSRSAIIEVPGGAQHGLPKNFNIDTILNQTNVTQHEIISRGYLNRDQTLVIKEVVHDVRILQRARKKESTVFMLGRVYYLDVYDRTWSTIYCYQWEPWHAMGERFYPYESFNGEDQTAYPEQLTYRAYPVYPNPSHHFG